jgi:SAM-dependent methyltransferase
VSRVRANLAALTVLCALQHDARPAAAAEQAALARWSGWGAVPEVFDETRQEFAWARAQLQGLLSPAELAAARRNTLNAHYTGAALVQAIWDGARRLGFGGGQVLEPGCGSGNFIAFAPDTARVTGVELDPVTAGIAAALYPNAQIRTESFADTRDSDGVYDLAIGNVPFGKIVLRDQRHNAGGHSIHNHFIIKSLHLTRPGGLVMILTSRYTMDARNPAARREIASLADLVGAVRLPSGAHQQSAGTSVVTDLLVLRRREPGCPPDPTAWEQARVTEMDGAPVPVNEYFLGHPEMVLGELGAVHGAYNDSDLVVRSTADTAAALTQALDHIAASARTRGLTWVPAASGSRPPAEPPARSAELDGFLRAHADGTFTRTRHGNEVPHPVPRTQAEELRHLLRLRDTARALLDAEATFREDTPHLRELRADLNHLYDTYLATYGPINHYTLRRTGRVDRATGEPVMARVQPPRGGFADDPYAPLVHGLEEFEPVGQRAAKAAIFRERVIAPPRAAPGRRHPGRRAGHLPGHPRRSQPARDCPPAGHHRG